MKYIFHEEGELLDLRNRTLMDTVRFQLGEINKYLQPYEQRVVLSEQKETSENELYWNLIWYRPNDEQTEIEEHIFGGDDLELFATLTGIKYGIRMKNYICNTESK